MKFYIEQHLKHLWTSVLWKTKLQDWLLYYHYFLFQQFLRISFLLKQVSLLLKTKMSLTFIPTAWLYFYSFSSLFLKWQNGSQRYFPYKWLFLHVWRDSSSGFLHVELSGAFRLSVDVLSDCCVEALCVAANVRDDKGVTTPLFEDANIITLLHSCLWKYVE